jgi:MerR family transcriptional regulator, copper efflux regulator
MRITEAAQRLGTSPRMLRYRDLLGLLPPVREPASVRATNLSRAAAHGAALSPAAGRGPGHQQFGEDDLAAVALALGIEQRYDISPAALAFGLRVLAEPGVRAEVAELGRRIGRIGPLPARALEFEKERALRLLSLAPGRRPERPASQGRPANQNAQQTRTLSRSGAQQTRTLSRRGRSADRNAEPAGAVSRPER